jgi:hypothetical protein
MEARIWTVLAAMLLALAVVVALGLHESRTATKYSAHAALASEIHKSLSAVPMGTRYPDSVSLLLLKYPDGGDASLHRLFVYQSSGTSCTLRTRLGTAELAWSFP